MPQPVPVSAGERVETLDVLRGFALLGILAMNIRAMAAPFSAYMYPYASFEYTGASRAAYVFTSVFFDLKMMGLFSMLFGASVLLYAAKGIESGRPPRGLWFRRMFWLLVIGLVHAYLIWDGDILVPYAFCGLLFLWWVRRLPGSFLLAGAVLLLAIGMFMSVLHGLSWPSLGEDDRAEQLAIFMPSPEQVNEELTAMLGGFADVVSHRAAFAFAAQTGYFVFFFLWRCGGMMLLGMALYKWGFLDGGWSTRAYAITAATCLPIGLALAGYGVVALEAIRYAMPERTIADLWNYAGAVLTSVGYAAVLILIVKRDVLAPLRRALAAVGRMALTNYLLQSVMTSVLFLGWGFGLAGRLDYAAQLLVVVAIWAIELAWSQPWLRRFRFGPVEWLWRSLTYWKLQPIA